MSSPLSQQLRRIADSTEQVEERLDEYRDALQTIEAEPVTGSPTEWVAWAREFISVVLSVERNGPSPEPKDTAPAQPLEQRFTLGPGIGMHKDVLGDWVPAEDHDRVVSSLQQERDYARTILKEEADLRLGAERRAEQAEQRADSLERERDEERKMVDVLQAERDRYDDRVTAFYRQIGECEEDRQREYDRARSLEKRLGEVREKLEDWDGHTLRKKEMRVAEVLELLDS